MSSTLIDVDMILSNNAEWLRLDEEWGKPVDLDVDDDHPKLNPAFSSLDLMKSTFDSSILLKKVRRKVGRQLSKKLDYNNFLEDLQQNQHQELPEKQFYFINGQIISAYSVEQICNRIDDVFQSVERLYSATSTVRTRRKSKAKPKPKLPDVVQCSISTSGLSFDDTVDFEKEKTDNDDVDRYIDEVFQQLNSTIVSLSRENLHETNKESVTTLVKKFSEILNNPSVICNPRKKRECCDRFKNLVEFWKGRAAKE